MFDLLVGRGTFCTICWKEEGTFVSSAGRKGDILHDLLERRGTFVLSAGRKGDILYDLLEGKGTFVRSTGRKGDTTSQNIGFNVM